MAARRGAAPRHVAAGVGLLALVVVATVAVTTLRPGPPSLEAAPGHVVAWLETASDGPYLSTLEASPEDAVAVWEVDLHVVGDGRAEAGVCAWAGEGPPLLGFEPIDDPVVAAACDRVEAFEPGVVVGSEARRSLLVRFTATGPEDATVCALSARLSRPGGEPHRVQGIPVGVGTRGSVQGPLDLFGACPDAPTS